MGTFKSQMGAVWHIIAPPCWCHCVARSLKKLKAAHKSKAGQHLLNGCFVCLSCESLFGSEGLVIKTPAN